MSGVNKAVLIGNLGKDPELKECANGSKRATFTLATSEQWKDKETGAKRERTEWHRIVAWGRTAELVGEHLAKGRQVYVEGRIQTNKWQDKEGHDRYSTEVVADRVTFLGRAAQRAA